MHIGQKIKEFREEVGLTQKELGERVHVSESAIGNYETGKRSPSIELLKAIADVLDVSLDDFFEEKEQPLNPLTLDEGFVENLPFLENEIKNRKKEPVEHTFLVVDELGLSREIISYQLGKQYSCMVYEEEDELRAISIYETYLEKGKPFDMVFMDMNITDNAGIDALKKIKELHPESVVIMCASFISEKLVLEALNAGANHFLSKPYDEKEIIKKANHFLKKETL